MASPLRLLLAITLLGSGCGGDDDRRGRRGDGGSLDAGGGGGDAGAGDGGGLGCDPASHCGAGGFVCGVHAVASCGEVDCGLCRFRSEDVGLGDIVAAPDGSIHLAFFDETGLVYARVGEAGLERETIGDALAGSAVSIAVAEDGTVHVVFVSDAEQVVHAEKSFGATSWDVQMAAETGEHALVAVDEGGELHIVVFGENPTTRARELVHVTRSGGTYAGTVVEGLVPVAAPALARGPDGTLAMAVRSDIREIAVLELVDGSFVRDSGISVLDDQPAELSLAVEPDGTIHVAAILGNYTLRTGSTLVLLTRSGGEWATDLLADTPVQVTDGMALAAGPTGSSHLAYYANADEGLHYTRAGSSRVLTITPFCEDGWVRMAVDGDDQPHLLYECISAEPTYIAPIERYPDEYVEACNSAADRICDRACDCGAPDCCYGDSSADSGGCTFGPGDTKHSLCVERMLDGLCSDRTAAPDDLLACRPLLDSTEPMCLDTKYVVPDACWSIIAASR